MTGSIADFCTRNISIHSDNLLPNRQHLAWNTRLFIYLKGYLTQCTIGNCANITEIPSASSAGIPWFAWGTLFGTITVITYCVGRGRTWCCIAFWTNLNKTNKIRELPTTYSIPCGWVWRCGLGDVGSLIEHESIFYRPYEKTYPSGRTWRTLWLSSERMLCHCVRTVASSHRLIVATTLLSPTVSNAVVRCSTPLTSSIIWG